MKTPYIDDGFTRPFTLPEGKEWPEVKGTYRPLPGPLMSDFVGRSTRAENAGQVEEQYEATLDALLASLKSWDLKARDGKLVAISKESFSLLRKRFIEALFVRVCASEVDEGN